MKLGETAGSAEGRARRGDFSTAGEIFLTSVRLRRKQKANVLFVSEEPRQAGPSKTSDASLSPYRSVSGNVMA